MAQRILVIGAGIAGLATAVAMQRRGYAVTVVEERTDTSSGAGISIWPNALAALDRIGVGQAVRDAGGRITAGALRWRDGSWLRRPAPERLIKALGEPLVIVQRSALRDILTGALAPETIEYGLSAIKLTRAADGVRVRLSDGNDRTTDAVIGADGTRSVVARHLNGPLADRYVGYTAWRGVATCDGPRVGRRDTWSRRRNRPCADGCGSPVLVRHRARFGRAALAWRRIALSASKIRQLARTDSEDAGSDGPRRGAAQRPLRPHPRPDLGARARRGGRRRGSSDAPAPGSGRLPGLEDAAVLAACVDQADDLPTAFARFAAFRRRRVRRIVGESALLGRVVNLRPAVLSAAAIRATALVPEAMLTRHIASVAARSAFTLPKG